MSTRVAVVTTVLPDYKVHLYERLARRPGWELQLWHGPGRAAEALPDADPGDRIAHHSARNLHLTLGLPLVTVGRLIEQHDPRPILPSLVRARQLGAPLHLLVVGSGPLEGEAHDAATRLPGDHRHAVHLLPRQPLDETTRLLAACDAFVCPGTIGLNIVHGFAVGLPFVASSSFEHGPEEDYLLDGENGLRIDDVGAALVGALLRLWQEPALRRRLGEAALAFARAHLSPAEQARGFVEAIEYVLARRAGRQVAPPPREAPRLRTRLRA